MEADKTISHTLSLTQEDAEQLVKELRMLTRAFDPWDDTEVPEHLPPACTELLSVLGWDV